jgi:glycosyltransferase involved in cell wall biosynthesis
MQEQHGRVGIDCSHLATAGGIQTYLSNLLPALFHEAPHVAFVLYSRGRRKAKVAPDIASRASARVHAWAPSRWLAYAERKWSWPPVEWWTGPLAVFHATHFALPRLRGARSVLSVMDATYWRHPEFYSNRQLNEFGYRRLLPDAVARADRILAISESTKRDVVEFLGVAADKVWVVPLARDPAFNPAAEADRSATRRRYGLTRRFLIYPAGTLEPRKNLVRALDAFRAAFADPARRPMLVVTGVGALPADAGAAIDRWGLRADVRLISAKGPAELRSLLCCAEFGIYPSLYEGFGLPA